MLGCGKLFVMIILKKRTIFIAAAVILAVCISIAATVGIVQFAGATPAPNGKTVVIDAGHGGRDGGVSGTSTGIKESDINLAVAKSLRHFLEWNGYRVVMTRQNSDGLYGMAGGSKKLADMEARRKIIENAKPDLVVSIHQNSFPSAAVQGAQVFYAPGSKEGVGYAKTAQSVLNNALGHKRIEKPGDYFILQCAAAPALLIECGFLSNPEEERLLASANYQEKVAYAIYTAIQLIFDFVPTC